MQTVTDHFFLDRTSTKSITKSMCGFLKFWMHFICCLHTGKLYIAGRVLRAIPPEGGRRAEGPGLPRPRAKFYGESRKNDFTVSETTHL